MVEEGGQIIACFSFSVALATTECYKTKCACKVKTRRHWEWLDRFFTAMSRSNGEQPGSPCLRMDSIILQPQFFPKATIFLLLL